MHVTIYIKILLIQLVFFCDIYAAIIYIAAYIHYAKMILNEFVLCHWLIFNTGNTNSQVPLRPPRKEFGSKPMSPLPLQSPFKGFWCNLHFIQLVLSTSHTSSNSILLLKVFVLVPPHLTLSTKFSCLLEYPFKGFCSNSTSSNSIYQLLIPPLPPWITF